MCYDIEMSLDRECRNGDQFWFPFFVSSKMGCHCASAQSASSTAAIRNAPPEAAKDARDRVNSPWRPSAAYDR